MKVISTTPVSEPLLPTADTLKNHVSHGFSLFRSARTYQLPGLKMQEQDCKVLITLPLADLDAHEMQISLTETSIRIASFYRRPKARFWQRWTEKPSVKEPYETRITLPEGLDVRNACTTRQNGQLVIEFPSKKAI